MGLDVRENAHQGIAQAFDAARQRSGQLGMRGAQGAVGLGVDQVGDGLGLSEVHAPIEKCTGGELAGFRRSSPRGQQGLQDPTGHQDAAMAGDLHRVFAREGLGAPEDRHHDLIHAKSMTVHFTKDGHPRRERGRQSIAGRPQASIGHFEGLPSRETQDGQSSGPWRCRHRCDGISRIHNSTSTSNVTTIALGILCIAPLEPEAGLLVAALVEVMQQVR